MASCGSGGRERGGRAGLAWLLVGWLAIAGGAGAAAQDPEGCLFCHRYRGLSRYDAEHDRAHLFFVDEHYWLSRLGPHARLTCTDCHQRDDVLVVPHKPVHKVDCTRTCHLSSPYGLAREFSHANILEALEHSAHTPEALRTSKLSGEPLLERGQSFCLFCHDQPVFRRPEELIPLVERLGSRTFDRCRVCHTTLVPKDIAYDLRHVAARLAPARPPVALAQVCAVCHSDPAFVAQTGLHDAVASYARSFHGKAVLLGDERTANCLSCHVAAGASVHQMRPRDDPLSPVYAKNLPNTCRTTACHPGADPRIARASVHFDVLNVRGTLEFGVGAFFVVFTALTFGPSMLLVVLALFRSALERAAPASEQRFVELVERLLAHPHGRRLLVRFTIAQRIQHWVLVVLFVMLALTGFPLKFADQEWSKAVIQQFGGLGVTRLIHHWAGVALALGLVVHLLYVLFTIRQRCRALPPGQPRPSLVQCVTSLPMWITWRDAAALFEHLAFLCFLRKDHPRYGRFSVREKFEYLGVFWGTVLLGITGGLLWGEQLASHLFSGRVLNIALIAHTYEAFLAIIHVGILHLINVMFSPTVFPLSPATITGLTPPRELAEEHTDFVVQAAREVGIEAPEATS